jgi:hypothetical protein
VGVHGMLFCTDEQIVRQVNGYLHKGNHIPPRA